MVLLIPTFGNLPVVRECVGTSLPVPPGWRCLVHDSRTSERDGTREHLRSLARAGWIELMENDRDAAHGEALDLMVRSVATDWVVGIDSDVELLDRALFARLEKLLASTRAWLVGRSHVQKPGERHERLLVPRMEPHFFCARAEHILREDLSFTAAYFKAVHCPGAHGSGPLPGILAGRRELQICGDTGWIVFWCALNRHAFLDMPDDLWRLVRHREAQSRKWAASLPKHWDPSNVSPTGPPLADERVGPAEP